VLLKNDQWSKLTAIDLKPGRQNLSEIESASEKIFSVISQQDLSAAPDSNNADRLPELAFDSEVDSPNLITFHDLFRRVSNLQNESLIIKAQL